MRTKHGGDNDYGDDKGGGGRSMLKIVSKEMTHNYN